MFRDVQRQVLQLSTHFTIFDDVSARCEGRRGDAPPVGVTMPYKRDDIGAAGRRRGTGVREVHNGIEALPVSQFDDELQYRIARAIYS